MCSWGMCPASDDLHDFSSLEEKFHWNESSGRYTNLNNNWKLPLFAFDIYFFSLDLSDYILKLPFWKWLKIGWTNDNNIVNYELRIIPLFVSLSVHSVIYYQGDLSEPAHHFFAGRMK